MSLLRTRSFGLVVLVLALVIPTVSVWGVTVCDAAALFNPDLRDPIIANFCAKLAPKLAVDAQIAAIEQTYLAIKSQYDQMTWPFAPQTQADADVMTTWLNTAIANLQTYRPIVNQAVEARQDLKVEADGLMEIERVRVLLSPYFSVAGEERRIERWQELSSNMGQLLTSLQAARVLPAPPPTATPLPPTAIPLPAAIELKGPFTMTQGDADNCGFSTAPYTRGDITLDLDFVGHVVSGTLAGSGSGTRTGLTCGVQRGTMFYQQTYSATLSGSLVVDPTNRNVFTFNLTGTINGNGASSWSNCTNDGATMDCPAAEAWPYQLTLTGEGNLTTQDWRGWGNFTVATGDYLTYAYWSVAPAGGG